MEENPKQLGSNLADCRIQTGHCPVNCPECFYNRDGAFYEDIFTPHIPSSMDVADRIVRVNCGHDSNIQRESVIQHAKQYNNYFFNTSLPNVDFPGPVVLTLNGRDERDIIKPNAIKGSTDNIMFVRLRISTITFDTFRLADQTTLYDWVDLQIPVVLTFTSFYTQNPPGCSVTSDKKYAYKKGKCCYEWGVRHLNDYWCPTAEFQADVWKAMIGTYGRLIHMCGSPTTNMCAECKNCETFYWQFKKQRSVLTGGK